eukprot:9132383-Pyramimonas_sp.AAC.1
MLAARARRTTPRPGISDNQVCTAKLRLMCGPRRAAQPRDSLLRGDRDPPASRHHLAPTLRHAGTPAGPWRYVPVELRQVITAFCDWSAMSCSRSEVLARIGLNCKILNACLALSCAAVIARMAGAALAPLGPQPMQ